MSELRKQRERIGLTQTHVAFLLGTRQSNISAYEAGTLTPGALVGERITAFLGLTERTAHRGTWLGTLASHAAEIARVLSASQLEGVDLDLLIMRYVIGMNDAFGQVDDPADQQFFLTPPNSTGDVEVDALLAGMAVHWCRQTTADRTPAWTHAPHLYLDRPWWIGLSASTPTLMGDAFTHGVPSLRARAIFLDRKTMASV
jgi:transcriptional regulator with XRE-family HTH domain